MNELTPFQKECLYKASIGSTHKIIAQELYISTNSVNGYLRGARKKLSSKRFSWMENQLAEWDGDEIEGWFLKS